MLYIWTSLLGIISMPLKQKLMETQAWKAFWGCFLNCKRNNINTLSTITYTQAEHRLCYFSILQNVWINSGKIHQQNTVKWSTSLYLHAKSIWIYSLWLLTQCVKPESPIPLVTKPLLSLPACKECLRKNCTENNLCFNIYKKKNLRQQEETNLLLIFHCSLCCTDMMAVLSALLCVCLHKEEKDWSLFPHGTLEDF